MLVFSLAQGLFWAGIAATFLMGLGTAITVAAIAIIAVSAKGLAKRLSAAVRPDPLCGYMQPSASRAGAESACA